MYLSGSKLQTSSSPYPSRHPREGATHPTVVIPAWFVIPATIGPERGSTVCSFMGYILTTEFNVLCGTVAMSKKSSV